MQGAATASHFNADEVKRVPTATRMAVWLGHDDQWAHYPTTGFDGQRIPYTALIILVSMPFSSRNRFQGVYKAQLTTLSGIDNLAAQAR